MQVDKAKLKKSGKLENDVSLEGSGRKSGKLKEENAPKKGGKFEDAQRGETQLGRSKTASNGLKKSGNLTSEKHYQRQTSNTEPISDPAGIKSSKLPEYSREQKIGKSDDPILAKSMSVNQQSIAKRGPFLTLKPVSISPKTVFLSDDAQKTQIELFEYNSIKLSENPQYKPRRQKQFVHFNFFAEVMNIENCHVGTIYYPAENGTIETGAKQIVKMEKILDKLYTMYLTTEKPKGENFSEVPKVLYFATSNYPNLKIDSLPSEPNTIYLIYDERERSLAYKIHGKDQKTKFLLPGSTAQRSSKNINFQDHELVLLFVALLRVTNYKAFDKILSEPKEVFKNAAMFQPEYENLKRLGLDMEFRYAQFLDLKKLTLESS